MDYELAGKVALVTGGASGIGAECVRELVGAGARVVVSDVAAEAVEKFAAEMGGTVIAVAGDVRSAVDAEEMVLTAVEKFGRLDLAVNNAGVGVPTKRDVGETELEEWHRITGINLDGVFLCMRAELGAMLPTGGAIVNVASVMGAVGMAGASPYVAAKHGVVGLTKVAALEYAGRRIRVNAIGPGFIDTPLLSSNSPERLAEIAAAHPVGRLGTATEIARAILFLLSPAASFVTGSYFPVDGGYLAR
jgi:NAD(P)-dependent dehydrogenase (short-subunit alcohol dehydrogenase family)